MVPSKRSRAPSSSSFSRDADKPPESPETRGRHHHADRCPDVLRISPPDFSSEMENENGPTQIGNFLEQCCFCRKKLRQNDVVFMYGLFGAFCSPECRLKQIAYDNFVELSKRVRAKKGRTRCSNTKESEGHTVANQERPSFHI